MTAGKFPQPAIFLAAAWLPMAAATAVAQTDFGPVNVGASAAMTVTLTIPSAVTLGGISVATQGVPGLDFTNAGSGTCAAGRQLSRRSVHRGSDLQAGVCREALRGGFA